MGKYDFIDDSKWFEERINQKIWQEEIEKSFASKEEWLKYFWTTWPKVFDESCEKYPDRDALIFDAKNQRYTYREYQEAVNTFAKGLLKLGVQKGDRVGIWMSNCPEWMIVDWALHKIGAWEVPIDPLYRIRELEYILKQADISTLIMKDNFIGIVDAVALLSEVCPEVQEARLGQLNSEKFPELKNIICFSEKDYSFAFNFYKNLMEWGKDNNLNEALAKAQESVHPMDVFMLQYTSGTTGFPKGVMEITWGNICDWWHIAERMRLTCEDICVFPVPLVAYGASVFSHMFVQKGACYIQTERFNAEEVLFLIDKHKATKWLGSPAMFTMVMDHPNFAKYDISTLNGGAVFGAYVPVAQMKAIYEKLHMDKIINVFGQTEGDGIMATSDADEPLELKSQTVGRSLPNQVLKIKDPNPPYRELPPNTQGEICGHNVYPGSGIMLGYYKDPEKTAATLDQEGWLHYGDLGEVTEDGYLKITGRIKEMIVTGGRNVYATEIESFLATLPQVSRVAVFAIPDYRLGEVPATCIELKPGLENKITEYDVIHTVEKNLASYKVPRYVRFVKEFPMTPSGKLQKFKLAEKLIQETDLNEVMSVGFVAQEK